MISVLDLKIAMCKAEDIAEGKNYTAKWEGFLVYNDSPLARLEGYYYPQKILKQDGGTTRHVKPSLNIFEAGYNDPDFAWGTLNIESKQKGEKDYKIAKCNYFNFKNFELTSPISGFFNEDKFIAKFNEYAYNFWTSEESVNKFSNQIGKELETKVYQLDTDDIEITDDICKSLFEIYPDFDDWYTEKFPKGSTSASINSRRAEQQAQSEAAAKILGSLKKATVKDDDLDELFD